MHNNQKLHQKCKHSHDDTDDDTDDDNKSEDSHDDDNKSEDSHDETSITTSLINRKPSSSLLGSDFFANSNIGMTASNKSKFSEQKVDL